MVVLVVLLQCSFVLLSLSLFAKSPGSTGVRRWRFRWSLGPAGGIGCAARPKIFFTSPLFRRYHHMRWLYVGQARVVSQLSRRGPQLLDSFVSYATIEVIHHSLCQGFSFSSSSASASGSGSAANCRSHARPQHRILVQREPVMQLTMITSKLPIAAALSVMSVPT